MKSNMSIIKNIEKTSTKAVDLEMTIASLFENVIRAKSELGHIQETQLRITQGLARELLENLQKANEVYTCKADFTN